MSWVSIPWDFGGIAAMLASAEMGAGLRNRPSQELPAGSLLVPYELLRGCIAAAWLALEEGRPTGSWAAHALKSYQGTDRTTALASEKTVGILLFQPVRGEAFQLQCLWRGCNVTCNVAAVQQAGNGISQRGCRAQHSSVLGFLDSEDTM